MDVIDVIDVLERIGADAEVLYGREGGIEQVMADAQVTPGLRSALVARDSDTVYRLLGRGLQMSAQVPADEEEGEVPADDGGEEERVPGTVP